MEIVVGVLVAVLGWLVNEHYARRAVRRNMRIDYLCSAYRRLERATNREMSPEHKKDLEEAIADIQLLGSPKQVELAHYFAREFSTQGDANADQLLRDLSDTLRNDLLLKPVLYQRVYLRMRTATAPTPHR